MLTRAFAKTEQLESAPSATGNITYPSVWGVLDQASIRQRSEKRATRWPVATAEWLDVQVLAI